MSSRIAPGGLRDLGPVIWAGSRVAGRVTHTEPPSFITVLGRGRRQFWGWFAFAGSLMPFGTLRREETEAVILHVSAITGCRYENEHHRHLARRTRLTPEQIEDAASAGPLTDSMWNERERALLAAAEQIVTTGDIDDDAWATLRAHLDERQAIELVQLSAHYLMLGTSLRVLRVEPDAPRGH